MRVSVRVLEALELFPDSPVADRSVTFRWPDDPPRRLMLRNVTRPTLTPVLPDPATATGLGVVVCPGGAQHFLAVHHEGDDVATALAERGIAAFVLRYRVAPTAADDATFRAELGALLADPVAMHRVTQRRAPEVVEDVSAAFALVEAHPEWGVDRLGTLGFSAGAFVATRAALEAPVRPAFVGALYGGSWGGPPPGPDAPPAFLGWALDDEFGRVILDTCEGTAAAWRAAGASVETHVYERGGHGFGIETHDAPTDAWFDSFVDWLGRLPADAASGAGAAGAQ